MTAWIRRFRRRHEPAAPAHYFERVGPWWVCECGLWRDKYGKDVAAKPEIQEAQ